MMRLGASRWITDESRAFRREIRAEYDTSNLWGTPGDSQQAAVAPPAAVVRKSRAARGSRENFFPRPAAFFPSRFRTFAPPPDGDAFLYRLQKTVEN